MTMASRSVVRRAVGMWGGTEYHKNGEDHFFHSFVYFVQNFLFPVGRIPVEPHWVRPEVDVPIFHFFPQFSFEAKARESRLVSPAGIQVVPVGRIPVEPHLVRPEVDVAYFFIFPRVFHRGQSEGEPSS